MKKLIYFSVFLLVFASCDDELEQMNPNIVTQENFWKTEGDVQSALAATYKVLRENSQGYWNYRGAQFINARGDDFFIRNGVTSMYRVSTFTNSPTNQIASDIFTGCFTGIFRANQVIENTSTIEIPKVEKAKYIAEAKFLRGLNYFHLAINFGAVPLITKVPQTREDYFVKQSPVEGVWAQVVKDFQAAKDSLPASYPSEYVGRATKGAAIGYLAKAYVYQKMWPEAEKEFALLVGPDGFSKAPFNYDLLDNYSDNFIAENDNNKESLFEVQNQDVGGGSPWAGENANEAQGTVAAQAFAPAEVGGMVSRPPHR